MTDTVAATGEPPWSKKNRLPIMIDIGLGILFFVVAKATDIQTAALVGAAIGIGLVVLQRFIPKHDILGGLALFGIVILGFSAILAVAFDSDLFVKLRGTIMGLVIAAMFLADAMTGGRILGRRLARYIPQPGIILWRLSALVAMAGAAEALVNLVVVFAMSEDAWLVYNTVGDVIVFALFMGLGGNWIAPGQTAKTGSG